MKNKRIVWGVVAGVIALAGIGVFLFATGQDEPVQEEAAQKEWPQARENAAEAPSHSY